MTARVQQHDAVVRRREALSPHLVRLTLDCVGFGSTGVPDEWVGLVVPGQFQSRFYTVRSCGDDELVVDVVVHDTGLVTDWAVGGCVGDTVTLTEPSGSFDPPADAQWLMLVGDLTALPAMARITATVDLPTRVWAEVPDHQLRDGGYLPGGDHVTYLDPGPDGTSRLAEVVGGLDWPDTRGYFWMAGESAQMRATRRHLMRERRLASADYTVMGYWRAATRGVRPLVPGQGWADYDEAQP